MSHQTSTAGLLSHLDGIMNCFLDGECFTVWTPLDEDAVIVVHVTPQTLVLLGVEVLGAPDQHGPVLSAASQVFTIGAQIQIFMTNVKIRSEA